MLQEPVFKFYFMAHVQSVLLTDWLGQCKKYSSCVYEWMNEYCSMLPAFGAIVICIWRYFNCDYIVLLCVYKRELFGNTITTVSWYCRLLVFVYVIVLYARDINIDCRLYFIILFCLYRCTHNHGSEKASSVNNEVIIKVLLKIFYRLLVMFVQRIIHEMDSLCHYFNENIVKISPRFPVQL